MKSVKVVLAVAEIALDVILVLFAFVELLPRFSPTPALVYENAIQAIPGATTLITTVRNATREPLYDVRAQWHLLPPDGATLTCDPDAPPYKISRGDSPGKAFSLLTTAPLPADGRFRAYLHADATFVLSQFQITGSWLFRTRQGYEKQRVEVYRADEWRSIERQAYMKMALVITLLTGIIVASNLLLRTVRSKV